MPQYLYQGQKDSSGQTGPTLQRLADRFEFDSNKRKGLETLFETVAPMAMYSGDAEAALKPAFLSATRKGLILDKMKSAGASERQIYDALKLIFDGKGYNHFASDQLKLPPKGKNITKPAFALSNVSPKDSVGVRFKSDLPDNLGGFVSRDSSWFPINKANRITINSNLDDTQRANSFGHELQHVLDMNVHNRSYGTNPGNITEKQRFLATKQNQNVNPGQGLNQEDIYYHNLGEIRGRLNGLLNTEPEKYQGLSSVFEGQKYNPNLIWE